jgi:hypothetical protein
MPLVWAKTFSNGIVLLQNLQAVRDLEARELTYISIPWLYWHWDQKLIPPCPSIHLAPSTPSNSDITPDVVVVSASAQFGGPQRYRSIRCPAYGANFLSSSGSLSRSRRHLGPCVLISACNAKRASSASLWERAVFCFSASRSMPNCLLDASRCFERSLASPASLWSVAILPSVALLASFNKASILLPYGYVHTSASTATPKQTRAILSNSILCFSLRCASTSKTTSAAKNETATPSSVAWISTTEDKEYPPGRAIHHLIVAWLLSIVFVIRLIDHVGRNKKP